MPRRSNFEDDWEDNEGNFGSDDDDLDFDSEEDDEEPTIPCPYCRREIHEDAQRCPYCENYISAEDAPAAEGALASNKPLWFVSGLLLCLFIVILWIVGSR